MTNWQSGMDLFQNDRKRQRTSLGDEEGGGVGNHYINQLHWSLRGEKLNMPGSGGSGSSAAHQRPVSAANQRPVFRPGDTSSIRPGDNTGGSNSNNTGASNSNSNNTIQYRVAGSGEGRSGGLVTITPNIR